MLDLTFVPVVIGVMANLLLGALVLAKSPRQREHQIFSVFTVLLSTYILASFLSDVPIGEYWQDLFVRLDFAAGVLGAFSFFLLTVSLSQKKLAGNWWLGALFALVLVLALLSMFTNLIIQETQVTELGLSFTPGVLDTFFVTLIVALLVVSIVVLFRQYMQSESRVRLQFLYILMGSIVTGLLVTISLVAQRVILAAHSTDPSLRELGLVILPAVSRNATLVLTAAIAYALLRHRLFGIRVVLGKLIFWFSTAAFLFGIFYAVALTELKLVGSLTHPTALVVNVFVAIVVAMLFSFYEQTLRKLIDRFVGRYSFDADVVIQEFIVEASSKTTVEEMAKLLLATVERLYRPVKQGVVVASTSGDGKVVTRWEGFSAGEVDQLENQEGIDRLLRHRVGERTFQPERSDNQVALEQSPVAAELGIDVALPLVHNTIEGVFVLGLRKGGHAYAAEDIGFLENLSFYASLNLARLMKN